MFGIDLTNLLTFNLFTHKEQQSDKAIKKTSGWSEETRNQFHPGVIIAAIRLDSVKYSPYPHSTIGLAELASHTTGQGREYFQRDVTVNGGVAGFNFIVLPLLVTIRRHLIESYPEIAKFAESLSERNLKKIFRSREDTAHLIEEIEEKFGKTITVQPLDIPKDRLNEITIKLQQKYVQRATLTPFLGAPSEEPLPCRL
ncbi:hypothetical protein Lnau_2881 [Legionella nautarum]|uniref:Uncharacterized protein n=1 Tax=Legionella nautarum TaxID=45070 RepID=A0A0W0WLR2_9GAMM|nr:hypothetical protein [Legionella nautarum]KTD33233.1 hypothetical protein Lnau_2881 [Legionella nautarum]